MPVPKSKRHRKQDHAAFDRLAQEVRDLDAQAVRDRIENPMRVGVLSDEPERELGRRIQEARQHAGLTQGQLAERTARADKDKVGISAPVVSLYERGVNKPGPKELRLICEALRVAPNRLLYGDDDPFRGMLAHARFGGWATSEPEFLAVLTYCFGRLHHHHKEAIMDLMMGLLRGWNRGFDADMDKGAVRDFLLAADELRLLLKQRERVKK
jgi:transcriptional regulator with XRE-family HTH domain